VEKTVMAESTTFEHYAPVI